mmetsp:Transcript_13492/g.46953  ORF Transcript_13492/g.46953 Transcript_13492/m.46953 type:complete len:336 (-) Transcript_13492:721-1728(-)
MLCFISFSPSALASFALFCNSIDLSSFSSHGSILSFPLLASSTFSTTSWSLFPLYPLVLNHNFSSTPAAPLLCLTMANTSVLVIAREASHPMSFSSSATSPSAPIPHCSRFLSTAFNLAKQGSIEELRAGSLLLSAFFGSSSLAPMPHCILFLSSAFNFAMQGSIGAFLGFSSTFVASVTLGTGASSFLSSFVSAPMPHCCLFCSTAFSLARLTTVDFSALAGAPSSSSFPMPHCFRFCSTAFALAMQGCMRTIGLTSSFFFWTSETDASFPMPHCSLFLSTAFNFAKLGSLFPLAAFSSPMPHCFRLASRAFFFAKETSLPSLPSSPASIGFVS